MYYIDHNTRTTSRNPPIRNNVQQTNVQILQQEAVKTAPKPNIRSSVAPLSDSSRVNLTLEKDLPPGWQKCHDAFGRVFYRDHNTQTKSWTPPIWNNVQQTNVQALQQQAFRSTSKPNVGSNVAPPSDSGRIGDMVIR